MKNKTNKGENKSISIIIIIIIIIAVAIIGVIFYFMNRNNNNDNPVVNKYEIFDSEYKLNLITNYNEYLNFEEEHMIKNLKVSDFEDKNYILLTINNFDDCHESIEYKSQKYDSNNNLNLYFDMTYRCGVCAPYNKVITIPVSKDDINIDSVKVLYRVTETKECDQDIVYKPIIYIYPEKEMDITIKLKNDKLLTHTYPKYNNKWNIRVDKTGNIYDYKTNKNYYALYWEAIDNTKINMNEGFVVKGEDTVKFLEEKLAYLGLNEREINEFIIYWIDKLENNNYNFIRFRNTDEVNSYMPLEISETPDTLIRVIMDFKPLDKYIDVKEQKLEKVTRKGYTIVEWGGRKIK